MTTGLNNQMDALQHVNESALQWKTCRCGDVEGNPWMCTMSDNHEKQPPIRCSNCQNLQVFKSGPLLVSSRGLGWTSWKKRWFVLTRTSLVFFRSDPDVPTQKGSEAILSLGGIDLNSSGSVVARSDKKLLTVVFPNGRDGQSFALKVETSEDIHEWKTALECALSNAPSAPIVFGRQSSIFPNDMVETMDGSLEQLKDRRPTNSTIIGRPVLLALEDVDGNPSFLEKALRFIEKYGIRVEGILRQSADVEEVERRVVEYEKGKTEFSSDEDAHVIGDCIKHVLREMPSSPVPASCCTALLEAFRGDRESRVSCMGSVIFETFPDPNRRLLQRILQMMNIVADHKSENLMMLSSVAACMSPLLLRPLLAGECELGDGFDIGGDGSMQLLQAAAAANHAQAMIIVLLEKYNEIFSGDYLQDYTSESYSETEGSEGEDDYGDEESTDCEIDQVNHYPDDEDVVNVDVETDNESGSDLYDNKAIDCHSDCVPSKVIENSEGDNFPNQNITIAAENINALEFSGNDSTSKSPTINSVNPMPKEPISCKHSTRHRHTSGMNLSMESIEYLSDDEIVVRRLEIAKSNFQNKLAEEVKENERLQTHLGRRNEALHDRRLALQHDVERIKLQLKKERGFRASLETELLKMQTGMPVSSDVDGKMRDLGDMPVAEEDNINLKHQFNKKNLPEGASIEKSQNSEDISSAETSRNKNRQMLGASSFRNRQMSMNHKNTKAIEATSISAHKPSLTEANDVPQKCIKGEIASSPSLWHKQPQWRAPRIIRNTLSLSPAITSSYETPTDASKKISPKVEDMISGSSSALSRLTNRLNFLKERRVQLVNELQEANTSTNHNQTTCLPPRTNSIRQ